MNLVSLSPKYVLCVIAVALTGCSLEPKSKYIEIRLDLDEVARDYAEARSFEHASLPGSKASPSTLGGFTCLGVNIVGPGIPDSSQNPSTNLPQVLSELLAGNTCAYRGVVAGPILPVSGNYGASELSLSVPSGVNRVIQIVGIVDTRAGAPACASGPGFANDSSNVLPKAEYYEVGRAKLDLVSAQTVSLTNQWPSGGDNGRRINCGDAAAGGPPAINSVTTSVSGVTNLISWPVTFSVSGTYNEYCWLENDTTIANCTWTAGDLPPNISVGGTNNAKVISFWIRNTITSEVSARFDLPSVTLDTSPPTVAISAPAALSVIPVGNLNAYVVTGACSENGQPVVISGSASATVTCTSGVWNAALDFVSAGEGTVTVSATQVDAAGNVSSPAARSFVKDTILPTVTINSPVGGENLVQLANHTILWNLAVDANLGPAPIEIEFSQDGGVTYSLVASALPNSGSFNWMVPIVMSPTCRIRIKVTDLAGNLNFSASPANFSIAP